MSQMIQEIINLTKDSIKHCEESQLVLESRSLQLKKDTEDVDRNLFNVKNVKESLEVALKSLEEANEKQEKVIKGDGQKKET